MSVGIDMLERNITLLVHQNRWQGANTECRYHRFTIGEDDGKRGIRGFDGGKLVSGQKRHLVVDTMGLIHALHVHEANIHDSVAARPTLSQLGWDEYPRLEVVFANSTLSCPCVQETGCYTRCGPVHLSSSADRSPHHSPGSPP